ncbi:hypothetical protein [Stutzerimonas frequens]
MVIPPVLLRPVPPTLQRSHRAYGEGFGGHTASISQNGLGNSATVTQR